jgi:hypothetical protein
MKRLDIHLITYYIIKHIMTFSFKTGRKSHERESGKEGNGP